ncbi:hypothetical protein SAMN05444166_8127 [Singulisphaera sp. GP187]|uniref:hypothetical protein n=1 Tax=Singulisphaera sp. GP187 TaxID=1882752 RepID=UPI000929A5B1|nr:hypothetical protein [Singulisphaera sp. GP187]SIO66555.1 hypothetical protein SAMN05444166_8127 [Singulisphaera sp. GP187]
MSDSSDLKFWRCKWLLVFSLNLIVPLIWGWPFTDKSGRLGMGIAIFLAWLWPMFVGEKSQRFLFAMVVGGGFVAALQICPVIQMVAGMVGITVTESLELAVQSRRLTKPNGELAGFLTTAITGSVLQAVALVFGAIAYLLTGRYPGWPSVQDPKKIEPCLRPQAGMFDPELDVE